MKIKRGLIGALAITAILGVSSLGVVNADDSSNTQTTTSSTVECPQDGTGTGAQDGTGIGAQNKNRGCNQSGQANESEQTNTNGQGKQKGQGRNKAQGTIGKNSYFMKSVQELQSSGEFTEEDVQNIQEYHMNNRTYRHNKEYDGSCTKIDDMVSKNIITAEQGENLKETLEKNLNVTAE